MMKIRWLIPLIFMIAILIGIFLCFQTPPNSGLVLVFTGYEISSASKRQIAKLELRNSTGAPIWLQYSGEEFPLRAPFLERPLVAPPRLTNSIGPAVYSLRAGSFFFSGEPVLPGGSVAFEFPIFLGEPAKQAGVVCYTGTFADGNDFLGSLSTTGLNTKAGLKDKAAFYLERLKRKIKAPRYHEVWCTNTLSFQSGLGH
jgi:hypothetical protein